MGAITHILGGAAAGFLEGGPVGALAGGVTGAVEGTGPSNFGNINSSTDPTLAAQQALDQAYEWQNLDLEAEEMNHQVAMQEQSQQFNDVEDEKTEQMRESNTLREVAMKQREADDKIVKDFIKTAGGD